jgi:hypothetical protein
MIMSKKYLWKLFKIYKNLIKKVYFVIIIEKELNLLEDIFENNT